MNVLERPIVVEQFQGQIVEQSRMAGRRAVAAEIAGRVDDSGAKVELPHAVDNHFGKKSATP